MRLMQYTKQTLQNRAFWAVGLFATASSAFAEYTCPEGSKICQEAQQGTGGTVATGWITWGSKLICGIAVVITLAIIIAKVGDQFKDAIDRKAYFEFLTVLGLSVLALFVVGFLSYKASFAINNFFVPPSN